MKIGLIGYGKMGRGILSLASETPHQTVIYVRDSAKAEDYNRKHAKRVHRGVASGLVAEAELNTRLAASRFTSSLDELADCDLCIESVVEDWDLKVNLLQQIEESLGAEAVLATNSSSFSPTKLSAKLKRPERFLGFHFFHPVQLTTITEIIVGEKTQADAVERAQKVSLDMNRRPIVVRDHAGSAINVILTGLSCEALYILEQGAALPSRVDSITGQVARLGPCEAIDTIGVTFFTEVLKRTLAAYPFKLPLPALLQKLIHDGRDGKYSGTGIFLYRDDRPFDDDHSYYRIPSQTHSPEGTPCDDDSLLERMLLQIFYCILLLTEKGIGDLDDFCFGIRDLIGIKDDPREMMNRRGGENLRADFLRLQSVFGDRFDPEPIARTLDSLSPR